MRGGTIATDLRRLRGNVPDQSSSLSVTPRSSALAQASYYAFAARRTRKRGCGSGQYPRWRRGEALAVRAGRRERRRALSSVENSLGEFELVGLEHFQAA